MGTADTIRILREAVDKGDPDAFNQHLKNQQSKDKYLFEDVYNDLIGIVNKIITSKMSISEKTQFIIHIINYCYTWFENNNKNSYFNTLRIYQLKRILYALPTQNFDHILEVASNSAQRQVMHAICEIPEVDQKDTHLKTLFSTQLEGLDKTQLQKAIIYATKTGDNEIFKSIFKRSIISEDKLFHQELYQIANQHDNDFVVAQILAIPKATRAAHPQAREHPKLEDAQRYKDDSQRFFSLLSPSDYVKIRKYQVEKQIGFNPYEDEAKKRWIIRRNKSLISRWINNKKLHLDCPYPIFIGDDGDVIVLLKESTDKHKLGTGRVNVYLGYNVNTGKQVAIKPLKRNLANTEMKTLAKTHQLVSSVREFEDEYTEDSMIVVDIAWGVTYREMINKLNAEYPHASPERKREIEKKKLKMADQFLKVVDEFHKLGYLHCDIKPENIMWDDVDEKATLIDFGFSEEINTQTPRSTSQGTRHFHALEVLRLKYSIQSDIYSCGRTLFNIFFNGEILKREDIKLLHSRPFNDVVEFTRDSNAIHTKILQDPSNFTLEPEMMRQLTPLLTDMTSDDPKLRPSIEYARTMIQYELHSEKNETSLFVTNISRLIHTVIQLKSAGRNQLVIEKLNEISDLLNSPEVQNNLQILSSISGDMSKLDELIHPKNTQRVFMKKFQKTLSARTDITSKITEICAVYNERRAAGATEKKKL